MTTGFETYAPYESILASTTLPITYVDPGISTSFTLGPDHSKVVLALTLTKGTITSFEWMLQSSPDGGTTWFTACSESAPSSGTYTVTKAVERTIAIAALGTTDTIFIVYTRNTFPFATNRVLFKETGTKTDERMAAAVYKMKGNFSA